MATDELLQERAKTHGNFDLNSEVFVFITTGFQRGWRKVGNPSCRAYHGMHMIATKLARMCSSPDGYKKREHLEDIIGYCKLIMEGEPEPEPVRVSEPLTHGDVVRARPPKDVRDELSRCGCKLCDELSGPPAAVPSAS